jgi:hypothetical protein
MNKSSDSASAFLDSYTPHAGLPPLASLGSFEKASQPGLSVEQSVYRLKRHHYVLKRLHYILISRIASEPIYELKMAFSYHAYLFAENISAIRSRVGEMREPPLGLDKVPDPNLKILFDEIQNSPSFEILLGIYEIILPRLLAALTSHREEANLLADQPTRRLCRLAKMDMEEVAEWGRLAIQALVGPAEREEASAFLGQISEIIEVSQGLDGSAPKSEKVAIRKYSLRDFIYEKTPRRDSRFSDPYNMGVNAEHFIYDPTKPNDAKVLMMLYKRLREIDVPEVISSILTETCDKPWDFYRDLTRQLWDEARHAMMGEVGFVSLGLDWAKLVKINFTWSYVLNTQLTAQERHAVLYFIEQGLMNKTGKRHEWEVALIAENKLSATFQDFDWADEVLHARVGRDWYVTTMASVLAANQYGDKCWNKVTLDWKRWKEDGLTQHDNWWPELYQFYCENNNQSPDKSSLDFSESYENKRADLRDVLPAE